MRLFLAFPPSPEVVAGLAQAESKLRSLRLSARFPGPESWHMTLLFLGERSPDQVGTVTGAVDRVWPSFRPPVLRLDRLDQFPRRGRPRVIVVRPERTPDILERIHRHLAEELKARALPPFEAHVTLARIRDGSSGRLPAITPCEWRPDRLVLFESRLQPTGAVYRPLCAWTTG